MADTHRYYSRYAILRFCIFVGLFLLFFLSCASRKENQLLLHADSLMMDHPDSALIFLENIPFPQELSRGDRALYALLLTQARHKNYITLASDSLIKTAVDYYGDKKRDLRAAQAHYYLGATYRDMGNVPFAVEEYLKAIELMPEENGFLAMIYDNLGECYLEEDLYDVAMEAFKKAYQILCEDKDVYYPLRGMAHVFLMQNQLDSALSYYRKAYNCVLTTRDSSRLPILYNDFATVYEQKKEYVQSDEYISKVLSTIKSDELDKVYRHKGEIMLGLGQLDSARYYFNQVKDAQDIYGKAVHYHGLYEVEKRLGNWEAAVQNADAYMVLYDSIQILSQSRELDRLMNNYQSAEQKKNLLRREKLVVGSLAVVFILLLFVAGFLFLWADRKRKKHYIALQHELTQKRVDVMLLKDADFSESDKEDFDRKKSELAEQQIQLCISMFKTTDCYNKLEALERATPKQLLAMRSLRKEIRSTISSSFVDVMVNLKEHCPALTGDDTFFCVLSLLCCSKNVMMELMDATSDALKTRKTRIKKKLDEPTFNRIFYIENQ